MRARDQNQENLETPFQMSSKSVADEEKKVEELQMKRRRGTSPTAVVKWLVGSDQVEQLGRCGLHGFHHGQFRIILVKF